MPTQVPQSVTVTLTDAQVKALPSTPVEIVPAPGANKMIALLYSIWEFATTVAYTNIQAGCQAWLQYSSGGTIATIIHSEGATALFGTFGKTAIMPAAAFPNTVDGVNNPQIDATSNFNNTSIQIKALNGAAVDFTGGNAGNQVKVTAVFLILDV